MLQQQQQSPQQQPALGTVAAGAPAWHTHVVPGAHAEVPQFVLQRVVLPSILHQVGAILLGAAHLGPVRHTLVLCGQRGWGEDQEAAGKGGKAEQ